MTDQEINALFDEYLQEKAREKAEKENAAFEEFMRTPAKVETTVVPPQEQPPKPSYVFNPNANRPLIRAILEDFVECGKISVSQIQRRFCKGHNAASAIMEFLEKKKFIDKDKYGNKVVTLTPYEIYCISPTDDEDD